MGRTFAVALGASVLVALGTAYADPPDGAEPDAGSGDAAAEPKVPVPVKDPKAAKKWLTAAQQLVTKGDAAAKKGSADDAKAAYDNAITAYEKAIEAGDDVNVYFALAQLEDRTGHVPDAIKHYKLLVATPAPKGVRADIAKQVPAKLDAATSKVGLVTLVIQPEGATVSLEGAEIGKAPLPEPLVLMPGKYKVAIAADGYQTKDDIELTVEAGSESERKLELEAVKTEVHSKHEEAYVPPSGPKPHKPSKLPMYIGGGVGVVALGTGFILGDLALRQHRIFVAPNTTPNARLDAQDFGKQYAHAADAFFGVAVASALFTGGWYWFEYRNKLVTDGPDESANPNAPKLVIAPWVQPDVSGLAAMGHF